MLIDGPSYEAGKKKGETAPDEIDLTADNFEKVMRSLDFSKLT